MKIGIVNGWGCNKGDEAIHSSLLCYLNSLDSQIKTTIYTDDNEWLDLTRHKKVKLKPWIRADDLWSSMPQKLRKLSVWMGLIRSESLYLPDENIMDHDFVFSAPDGPYFGDIRPFSDWEMQCLLQLAICHRKGIPFGILSTSSGPFLDKFRNTIRKPIFDKVKSELIETHYNWYIAIEPDSGEYFIDKNLEVASYQCRDKHSGKIHYTFRINETGTCGTI